MVFTVRNPSVVSGNGKIIYEDSVGGTPAYDNDGIVEGILLTHHPLEFQNQLGHPASPEL
ncbi:hypothetical protein CCP4SC76_6900008 [Gammaproteobacteria bacterium]